jgi:nitrile hydratase
MSHNPEPAPYPALRAQAIESLLVEKGLISTDAIDALVNLFEQDIGPLRGARVVARAWTDPEFKARLLADANAACAEMDVEGLRTHWLVVLEHPRSVHNMVVCTLCSCYPWSVLGLPPSWYKSAPYRSRAVIEPRAVLHEFGVELDPAVEVRVWDSSSEVRYMVLPERPPGTEGLSEDDLASLISRDAMIGVAFAAPPASAQAA